MTDLTFDEEHERTMKFVNKVWDKMGFCPNADSEVNESIAEGLTHMKIKHGKRYCPCFIVDKTADDNRVCPCKAALQHEIPNEGQCHCGIFTQCTTEA